MEQLKLDNQICFPFYAASRLIIRAYQPHLDKLGITYPQYLVMLVLWEQDRLPVNDIAQKLILNTNTVTPLLKRMETMGLIQREKSKEDERKVLVTLTQKGKEMEAAAAGIPEALMQSVTPGEVDLEALEKLKAQMQGLVAFLEKQNPK
ncbi:MarR family winged helix-turn-helix transcriptional regulator [Fontibacter flavus]|uniref:HTH-type transcriptional regulator SarZ n=1 Tax=Fontibacter flavus TaxID=654838 RepID=A0ABV6FXL3_9BACT|nr:MarR family transcriptional regulator [Cyclobacteriaceae bacterium]